MVENEKRNEEFLQWLSPSFGAVEAHALRVRRGDDTLKWAPNMSEIREWHCPPQSDGLSHRLSRRYVMDPRRSWQALIAFPKEKLNEINQIDRACDCSALIRPNI